MSLAIVVLGLMGAGKTTVGRRLAQRLDRAFLDGDDALSARHGTTAAALQATEGRAALHRAELAVLTEALDHPVVFAAAASVADTEAGRELLRRATVVVLRAEPAVLAERAVRGSHRPLRGGVEEVARVLADQEAARLPSYLDLARVVLDAGRATPDELADAAARELRWFRSAVVYQIYPRSFADANGDGVGDLAGITAHLDHLVALGVDVVWSSPVYRSPFDDNGYDISDYDAIDPTFGTEADFDALLDGLHRHGIKLVMDLVVNHTSDEHAWFVESRSSRSSPLRDWYWWRPPRPGRAAGTPGAEPNNWGSFFSGPAWTFDEATGEYYLHLFSRKQPDLNWEHPPVRQAVYAMMRRWLDRGVDGFRMDVINMLSKDVALPDGPTRPGSIYGDIRPHTFFGPRNHEFVQEMRREVFAGRRGRLLTVGETPGADLEQARAFTDERRGELDMVFQFEHVEVDIDGTKWRRRPFDLVALKASLARWQEGLAEVGWNSLYWDNHDQPRVVSRFGDDGVHRAASAKALATVLHLHRGTPYVYQGEELGMTNFPFSSLAQFRDLESINHHAAAVADGASPEQVLLQLRDMSRDNARTPMQWDGGPNAGFSAGPAAPWLAVNPNHVTINAAEQRADPDSVFHHHRRLIELRHREPTVVEGTFELLLADDPALWVFVRRLGRVELLVAANCSGAERAVRFDGVGGWVGAELVLASGGGDVGADGLAGCGAGGGFVLRPWAATVHRRVRSDERPPSTAPRAQQGPRPVGRVARPPRRDER